ncbi:MAG: DUF1667 domain-containing protein [Treponema sp.]|jgi:Uncharacterized protein with conserved CXXC pairs
MEIGGKKHFTCIICPMGCQLEVDLTGEEMKVSGNACNRGCEYAKKELTFPSRTLTCTVAVSSGERPMVSAKTAGEIPKEGLLRSMQFVRRLTIPAPVKTGDVLVRDFMHSGVDLVACENVRKVAFKS